MIASCSSIAAAAAADGRSKTENVASPSPRVLISRPPRDVTTCSTSSSCRASATAMASASASQAAVDPSMSVSRKVTARVTDGSCLCHSDFQCSILCDDRGLESPKLRSGVDSQLVGQQRPRPLISAKGFTLPAGAVEGEHQLAPSPFAQRRLGHRGLELADDLRGAARREQRVGPILHQRGVALDPARLFGCSPPAVGQFGDSAPEGKRLLEAGHRLAGVAGGSGIASQSGGRFVARGINLGSRRGSNPSPRVKTKPSPRVRRSEEMWVCRALAAVRGGSSPQSSSTSVSADTTEPPCSPSIVRMARGLAPGIATGAPSCRTCRGPKTPSSTD